MKTVFSKLKVNDWFKKAATGNQIFAKGPGKNYCNIHSPYNMGRIATKDFEVEKVKKYK